MGGFGGLTNDGLGHLKVENSEQMNIGCPGTPGVAARGKCFVARCRFDEDDGGRGVV